MQMNKSMSIGSDVTRRIKIIYNDDCAVINFLSDLTDREPLRQLQRFIDFGNHLPNMILHKQDSGLFTLILYLAPFGLNENGNKLTLFAHDDLIAMANYFRRWRENAPIEDKELYKSLTEIKDFIFNTWTENTENNTQLNQMG